MSSRVNILTMPQLAKDEKLAKIANNYKTYNSIRRDLRKAAAIVDNAITVKKSLADNQNVSPDILQTIFILNAALMHTVILYTR